MLVSQLRKVVDESELNNLAEDSDEITRKSKRELVELDLDNAKLLSKKKIFIGAETEKELKALGLTPDSDQIGWFYKHVTNFHITTGKFLQKYFKTALKDLAMSNMIALDPKRQCHVLTPGKLKSLVNLYSKIVDNIESFGGMDKVRKEIDQ